MNRGSPDEDLLRRAVRPLSQPPSPPGWNAAELADPGALPQTLCLAAVLVPLVRRKEGFSVLFTQRTDNLRSHPGQVSFPGGRIEPADEGVVAAALRETREETGISAGHVEPFGYLDSFATISGYCVLPVAGFVAQDHGAIPDGIEVASVFEVPLRHILAPDVLQPGTIDWHGRPRSFVEFDWQGHRVWGATAAILQNLVQRLENLS